MLTLLSRLMLLQGDVHSAQALAKRGARSHESRGSRDGLVRGCGLCRSGTCVGARRVGVALGEVDGCGVARELGAPVVRAPHRNHPTGQGNGPGHREVSITDRDRYIVVVASPDGEAYET